MSENFPEVRYAETNGVNIAYEVRGDGPIDLVRVPGTMTSLVGSFLDPVVRAHYDHLARFTRLIRLDKRGTGLSDPVVTGGAPLLEQQVEDIVAVMDKVGSERAALYGGADGGQVAILFAAMYPERVSSLVLYSTPGRPAYTRLALESLRERWGDLDSPAALESLAPSRLDEPGFARLIARVQQVSASRASIVSAWREEVDVSAALPLVETSTLVLCGADDELLLQPSQYLADRLPNARLRTYPGTDRYFGVRTPEIGTMIEEFLTGVRPTIVSDRVLATVMFTDIVVSTEHVTKLGDRAWREQLDRHDALVRAQLARCNGREISTAGDSFFMTFDGPARAIDCARAIIDGTNELGIDIRAGVHTGECEVRGGDYAGIAVHVGARVAALAGAGEIFVTRTVKDLVSGSEIRFVDCGLQDLKGIAEPWHIYRVN